MKGSDIGDLREELAKREAEVRELRERLEQTQAEVDRLHRENEQLREELKAAGGRPKRNQSKPKAKRKKPGRKAGKGRFTRRSAPAGSAASEPVMEVPVTVTKCPGCGGDLKYERTDQATNTDMPEQPRQK